jgi:hypothetical protein
MKLRCPKCNAVLQVPENLAGSRAKCRACGAILKLPAAGATSAACPSCARPLPPNAVICVSCGLDLKAGAPVETSAAAEEPQVEEEEPRPTVLPLVAGAVRGLFPGVFQPKVLLYSIAVGFGCWTVGVVALFFIMGGSRGALGGTAMIGATGFLLVAHAVAWLMNGEIRSLKNALTEFDGVSWCIFLALVLALTIGYIMLADTVIWGLLMRGAMAG